MLVSRLIALQCSLFTPGLVVKDKLGLAARLNEAVANLFDGDSAVLPLPDDAPSPIPRIVLRSKQGSRECRLSMQRLDLIWLGGEDSNKSIELPNEGLSRTLEQLRNAVAANAGAIFNRAAVVSNWMIELDKPGRLFLQDQFLRENNPIRQAVELELHSLEKGPLGTCDTNQWVRIKTARKADNPEDDRYLAVTIDINTAAEKSYEFSGETLSRFLHDGQEKTVALVAKYVGE